MTCKAILSETRAVKVGGGRASNAAFVGANSVIGPGWGLFSFFLENILFRQNVIGPGWETRFLVKCEKRKIKRTSQFLRLLNFKVGIYSQRESFDLLEGKKKP